MKYIRMNKYSRFIIDNLISVIDLKNAMIDTFPELPDNIVEIYLDNNDIPKISCQLPCNLRILSVCSNLITELLYIPPTLKELYISNNKNIVLLPKITTDLKVFQCTDCKLRSLPELPTSLVS
jgi:Leucine-rich repeat (LRR) protein